ncbi:TPA: PAS domain-containing protein [Candidatus Scatenecus faecavium]|uniref:histidine kinase n=1 Tax=Candidatus Scatenecus faecavium TaxID=2840915 RepID=A0A9D1FU47_9BACT|nr:PAS domain-containing protein [Candidatus Scatenecus faecavium]
MGNRVSLTTQNRLIISGLILSTVLIVFIAIFAIFNIQKKLNEGYKNFGQVISKILAIEGVEITRGLNDTRAKEEIKQHADGLLKSHNDIVLIEFRDKDGNLLYSGRNNTAKTTKRANITVTSPIQGNDSSTIGSVTVALSGNIISQISSTTRASLLFVFTIAWVVFAFVILINTYLITRELRILQEGVKKISTGEFGCKIESQDVSNEVKELFNEFNDMSNRLHIYEEQNIEQLTLERNKLEAVLMSIANGVVVCDNNDKVVLVNNHAQNLLEVGEENILNSEIQQYTDTAGNFCFKDKIEQFKDTPLEVIESKPLEFNIIIDKRVLKSLISPMFTRNKDYVGYIIVLIDVTREAEMEQMRAHFISNVSHELRTPVTVLRSYIDTLYHYGNEFDYETQKEFIGTINQEIIRLNRMVNDILDFSKLEADVKLEKKPVNMAKLVEDCINQVSILTQEHNIKVLVSKDDEIPDIELNYNSIERAFTNLMSNAIKYSPENGTITVKISALRNTNEVEVTVTDEGCGIAPEHQKKVFDRFYRVENNTHTIKGTGLGLNLVKTTIEKHHGGRVFVKSELGKGSTFGFILPVKASVAEDDLTIV